MNIKVPTMDKMELSNRKLVEEVIEKCDRRYANKAVERDVQKLVWGFIGVTFAVITFIATKGI